MENELLLFEIRSIADQAEQGFMKAAKSAQELGTAYEDLMKKEDKTEDQLASLSQKAKEHSAQMARAKLEEAKAIMQATEARIRDLKIVREDFREAQKYWEQQKQAGKDGAKASIELHNAKTELARIEKELNDARKDGKKALEDYNKAINNAVKSEEQLAKSKQEVAQATDTTADSSIALVAAIGALVGMYTGLKRILSEATQAYNDNRSAMVGLRSIAEGTGTSFGSAKKEIDKFIDDGLVPLADASTGLKNLLDRGFSLEESIDILNRFKDSAAFGRQASLELGEAVRTATEGIKNENSILVDNAGVTKNVSVMWKEYAESIGVGVQSLTLAQKREAEYQGIMKETEHQVGDALKLSQEFAGSQAALTAQTTQLKVALGEAATGGVAPFNQGLAGLVKEATHFVQATSPVITAVIQGTKVLLAGAAASIVFQLAMAKTRGSLLTTLPVLGKVTAGFTALKSAVLATTAGKVVAGIGAGLAILVGIVSAMEAAGQRAREQFEALNDEAEQLGQNVGGASKLVERFEELKNKAQLTKEETAEMNQISIDLVDNYGFRADAVDQEGRGIANNLELMKEQLEIERESLRLKLMQIEQTNTQTYKDAQQNLADTKDRQAELKTETEGLKDAYKKAEAALTSYTEANKDLINAGLISGADPNSELARLTQAAMDAAAARDANLNELKKAGEDIQLYTDAINTQVKNSINLALITAQSEGKKIPVALHNAMWDGLQALAENNPDAELTHSVAEEYIERYFAIDEAAGIADSAIEEIQRMKEEFIAALTSEESVNIQSAGQLVRRVFGELANNQALQAAFESGQELRKKIEEGKATPADKESYDKTRKDLRSEITNLVKIVESESKKLNIPTDGLVNSLNEIAESYKDTANAIEQSSLAEQIRDMDMDQFVGKVESAANVVHDLRQEMADWADLQNAIDVIKEGADNSEHYADALAWLADRYGVSEEAVLSSLDTYQADADMMSTLIDLKIALAKAEVNAAIGMVNAMATMDRAVANNSRTIITNLQSVKRELNDLHGTRMSFSREKGRRGEPKGILRLFKGSGDFFNTNPFTAASSGWVGYSGVGGVSRGGRGGGRSRSSSYSNAALDRELARIESLKHYNKITTQQEINLLNRAKRIYAKTWAEKSEISKRAYSLRQQLMDSNLNYQKSRDRLSLAAEVKSLARRRRLYKRHTEAYREADIALYQAQQQLARSRVDYLKSINKLTLAEEIKQVRKIRNSRTRGSEAWNQANAELYQLRVQQRRAIFDNNVYYNRLSLEQQREWLKQEIKLYKKGTEARIELEKELHDTIQQIRERDVERINTLTDAIQEAVKERYRVQQEAEVDRINKSIQNWQDWATNQKNAIQKQIDALDDLAKAEDRADKEQKKQRDIDALKQKIMYEHDLYNRQQLQKELAEKEKEFSKWKRDNERADLRAALQEQSKLVDEIANVQKDKLNEQLENTNKYYEQLSKDSAVNAQAEKILMSNSQKDILNLLKTYVPEYDIIGQSMGEKLVNGFTKKVGNIDKWFENFNKNVALYQNQMATVANQASTRYWQTRPVESNNPNAFNPVANSKVTPAIHVYFNQPIDSPSQMTRELERSAGRLGRM